MKILFMGTPNFAVPPLKALIEHHQVVAVCKQPDRPSGRGYKLVLSPVKELALANKIPVLQPETLKINQSKEIRKELKNFQADMFIVCAYGLILPKGVLSMPPLGCINIHASILPRYRGAAPIHASLLNGDKSTGITIMHMDTGMDTGDIITQDELPILQGERFPSLHDRMSNLGAKCIIEAVDLIKNGVAGRLPQDSTKASYAPMIKKNDGHINWNLETEKIINLTRAFDPWPGLYFVYNSRPVKIWQAEKSDEVSDAKPGAVLVSDPTRGLLIKTGDGTLKVTQLQAGGGRRMASVDYLKGNRIDVGTVLE